MLTFPTSFMCPTKSCNSTYRLRYWNCAKVVEEINRSTKPLQQYLPFTVLKQFIVVVYFSTDYWLEQYLPFTVLKLFKLIKAHIVNMHFSCNSTYRLRYWNTSSPVPISILFSRCNSTYRLRYWNFCNTVEAQLLYTQLQQYLPLAVLKQ